jgi:hypothetical protein
VLDEILRDDRSAEHGIDIMSALNATQAGGAQADATQGGAGGAGPGAEGGALGQGLTLVHFSAQPEPFLTQNTSYTP